MKKKLPVEPIVSPEIMELAKKSAETPKPLPAKRCAVCGSNSAPLTNPQQQQDDENLCWVCRRLKISAWRDNDQQMSAQE